MHRSEKRCMGIKNMFKTSAIIQVIVIILVVGYSTYQFFQGHFAQALATFPLLMAYYVFVIARLQRKRFRDDE